MLKNIDCEAFYTQRQVVASEATWHYRLAHTDLKVLQQLHFSKVININKSRTTPLCEPCQMGKRTRLQFFHLLLMFLNLLKGSTVIFGVLHQLYLFKDSNIMLFLLMSSQDTLGYIHFTTNLILSMCSRCFKQCLRINLTPQLKNFRVMEEVNLPVTC